MREVRGEQKAARKAPRGYCTLIRHANPHSTARLNSLWSYGNLEHGVPGWGSLDRSCEVIVAGEVQINRRLIRARIDEVCGVQ